MAPEDWTNWLSIATTVHNDQKNTTTGLSPNQILWGGEPCLMAIKGEDVKNQTISDQMRMMRTRQVQAIEAINRSTRQDPIPSSFMVGTQVWLEGTHLRLPYQATKLAPKRYGPFKITKEISPVAYQLCLPDSWNIHDVFHASHPLIVKRQHMDPTTPDHPHTLSKEKKSIKSKGLLITSILGGLELY